VTPLAAFRLGALLQRQRIARRYEELRAELNAERLRCLDEHFGWHECERAKAAETAFRASLSEEPPVDDALAVDDGHGLNVDDASGGLEPADAEAVDPLSR